MNAAPVRVLYVDDDPALVRYVQRALGRSGHTVEHVATGEDGLRRLDSGDIDVVVLDHYLPTGTGIDVLKAMAQREGFPPVVYVTGSTETTVAVDALKAGASDYVPKIVAEDFIQLLGSAIGQALERARLQREKARAEQEVREARDRAEVLLGEVNHRVANSLALVAALVGMQANALSDEGAKAALSETQARISAIAGVHRRLYNSDDVRVVAIDEYLRSLVEDLGVSMRAAGHHSLIRFSAPALSIPTDKAVSLGVIVTELVTNAFKYAYRDREQGEVRVDLTRTGERTAALSVADDGIGWDGQGDAQGTGLGSRIVKAMAHSLGSSVNYASGASGTRVTLDLAY